ncbi:MAG: AmmeMemoRadiSam system radical SAM enzyme, partial [Kiritimatiellia bacterium]|nr:AmmeMemoRadiSam system radical SAM enzyme [Kiritimatiellia bacterium]
MKPFGGSPIIPARYERRLSDGRIRCDLCPHHCVLGDGERGTCFVRRVRNGRLEAGSYGRISGRAVDPIEKKPLYHVLPGTRTLSFGAIGCNLSCDFCQNAAISQPCDESGLRRSIRPDVLAETARQNGCPSVAFTYNEPIVAFEFVRDAADECRAQGLRTLAVTAGYIEPEPGREFFGRMDAANVDLKAFTEDFYRRHCGASLAPVLRTLERIRSDGTCWLELTTLLIPGENDSTGEIDRMTRWIADHLGADVPLHLTAFFPTNRLPAHPPTPPDG